jgi:Domain of unknown function (DUF4365)
MSVRQTNELQRELSELYFQAVCNKSGYESNILPRDADLDGRDASIFVRDDFGDDVNITNFTMYMQVKSTTQDIIKKNAKTFSHDIGIKQYNKYRDVKSNEAYFVLVYVIPHCLSQNSWVCVGAKQLAMKGRMYWASLYGAPEVVNEATVSIEFKLRDSFDSKWLCGYAKRFAKNFKRIPYAKLQKRPSR